MFCLKKLPKGYAYHPKFLVHVVHLSYLTFVPVVDFSLLYISAQIEKMWGIIGCIPSYLLQVYRYLSTGQQSESMF